DRRRGRVDRVRGEEEVDPEDREADRAERDEPELDRPFRHPLAEEAPERDADREDGEEERHDALAPAEHLAREPGELREEERAVEPEPRDAEDREEHGAILAREADRPDGLAERVRTDPQVGV